MKEMFEAGLPDFYDPLFKEETASTNDDALALARGGAAEGTLVIAKRQSAGRGRRGRSWSSPEGNIHISLVLRPGQEMPGPAGIGFAASLAIAETLAEFVAADSVAVKWPNDVLIAGRKAAGLLIEAAGEAAERAFVLGVGINVAHHPADTPYPATSLAAVCADAPSTDAVVAVFADRFLGLYRTFKSEGLAPLRARWLALAGDLGGAVTVRLETRTLTGIFCDLDADGALILDLGDGRTERIRAGDVFPAEGEQGKGTDAARH